MSFPPRDPKVGWKTVCDRCGRPLRSPSPSRYQALCGPCMPPPDPSDIAKDERDRARQQDQDRYG